MGYLNPHTHNLDDAPAHIVTICGSTRFRAEMTEANRRLTLAGYIVLAPGVFAHDGDEITEQQKAALDRLHLSKIDMARWIYVVNPGGYIGESTRREIAYAESIDKPVQYLVPVAAAPGRIVGDLIVGDLADDQRDAANAAYDAEPWTVPVDHGFVGSGRTCSQCTRTRLLHPATATSLSPESGEGRG